jgi:hypothetical protein
MTLAKALRREETTKDTKSTKDNAGRFFEQETTEEAE